jgi:hypothetical protein
VGAVGGSSGLKHDPLLANDNHYGSVSKKATVKRHYRELPGGVKEAKNFFNERTQDYIDQTLKAGKYGNVIVRKMLNGDIVTLRLNTKTHGSPAVDINREGTDKIEKIHFI